MNLQQTIKDIKQTPAYQYELATSKYFECVEMVNQLEHSERKKELRSARELRRYYSKKAKQLDQILRNENA